MYFLASISREWRGTYMGNLIRVAVIDDHFVSRKGILTLLEGNDKLEVIAEGSAGNHVLELLEQFQIDVLITDLQMPADANNPKGAMFEPVSTLQKAIRLHPTISVIVVSQEHDVQTIQSLAEIGVKGYLLKTDDVAGTLGRMVEMVHAGALYFSPDVRTIIYSAPKINSKNPLTDQQMNVLRAIVRSPEVSREALAETLFISRSTIQKHISAIFQILDVPNMESCILKAMRMGLVDVESLMR
jgi:DNA-binding NarL/FixJ family response regulator